MAPLNRSVRQRGAAALEFALLLPILIGLLCGLVDIGRLTYHYNILLKGAREAARYLSTQSPGSAVIDKKLGGGTRTSWEVAKDMVLAYRDSLCASGTTSCLTATMVTVSDATGGSDGTAASAQVTGSGVRQNTVTVTITGYRVTNTIFVGYLFGTTSSGDFLLPTVSATFAQE